MENGLITYKEANIQESDRRWLKCLMECRFVRNKRKKIKDDNLLYKASHIERDLFSEFVVVRRCSEDNNDARYVEINEFVDNWDIGYYG
jgi:hypothetical protein